MSIFKMFICSALLLIFSFDSMHHENYPRIVIGIYIGIAFTGVFTQMIISFLAEIISPAVILYLYVVSAIAV